MESKFGYSNSFKISTHGVELSTAPDKFGWLQENTIEETPLPSLQSQMEDDGYLFLRKFWPREQVQAVRNNITEQLAQLGFINENYPSDEVRSIPGKEVGRAMGNPLDQKNPLLRELLFGSRITNFFESFLNGSVRPFDFIWFRTKGPGLGSAIHCDLVFMGRGTHDLYTAWVPLGDIGLDLGGLLVLEDSHKKSDKLSSYLTRDVDTYCTNREDAAEYASGRKSWDGALSKNAPELQESLGGRWLTAENYRMGDVLLFNMTLVHGSLDNQTDRIRLSTDTRYQLADEPVDERWIGEKPPGHVNAMKRGRIC